MNHCWRSVIGLLGTILVAQCSYANIADSAIEEAAIEDVEVADIEPADAEWKGKFKLGGSLNTGNSDNKNIAGGAVLNYLKDKWDLLGEIDGELTRAQGESTAEYITGRAESRYRLDDRNYFFVKAHATWDKFATYEALATESLGLGRIIWDTPDCRLLFELGPGATQRRVSGLNDDEYEAVLNLETRYYKKLSEITDFVQEVSVDIDRLNTHIEAVSILNTNITQHLALELSFRITHDTRIPPGSSNTKNTDTITRVAIVYEF